jgi:hypothetical protein
MEKVELKFVHFFHAVGIFMLQHIVKMRIILSFVWDMTEEGSE